MSVVPHIDYPLFDNHPSQPDNTCGQAVIASVFEFYGRYPDGCPDDRHAMFDYVLAQYGPNWPWRNMVTHPSIVRRALREARIHFAEYSRKSLGMIDSLPLILRAIDRMQPVVVLLDAHALGMARPFTLHWAVVSGYERTESLTTVTLATWGSTFAVSCDRFKRACAPRFLPKMLRNYMIVLE